MKKEDRNSSSLQIEVCSNLLLCSSKHYCIIAFAQTSGVLQTLNEGFVFLLFQQTNNGKTICMHLHILPHFRPIFCLIYGSGNVWEHNRTKAAVWH